MALSWLDRLWSSIADRGGAWVSISDEAPADQVSTLGRDLLTGRGEASGAAIARELLERYGRLGPEERLAFMRFLAEGFAPEDDRLRAAAEAYLAEPGPETASALSRAAEPPRQELIRRINAGPGGTAALVRMRQEMLGHLRAHPELKPLDADLQHLFASWFNRGFLELRRIDWDSSAAVLEKLITYEAVHEISGWPDLQRRLQRDRRCFAFFHPALPGEPLIFVEVALVNGISDKIEPLLALDAVNTTAKADTAIFYSISNCQEGLRGISFGNFLIKQVVEELRAELPGLVRFSTLSPVPGFRRWLEARIGDLPDGAELGELLAGDWVADGAVCDVLRPVLMRQCALYLAAEAGGRDPVARFHLGNGARLERINWLANLSPRGLRESFGIMVNYLYDPDTIEANHEAFARHNTVVHSSTVGGLLKAPDKSKGVSKLAGLASDRRKRIPA